VGFQPCTSAAHSDATALTAAKCYSGKTGFCASGTNISQVHRATGNRGKRYRCAQQLPTPFAVRTVDFVHPSLFPFFMPLRDESIGNLTYYQQ
jgi:hypothetical protein